MKKILQKLLVASIAAGSFIFSPQYGNFNFVPTVQAEIKTYTGTGDCIQGDLMTEAQSKNVARIKAELDAKEKAGIYLKIYVRQENFNIAENEISVVTNEIINFIGAVNYQRKTTMFENSPVIKYTATLKANINTGGLNDYINRESKDRAVIIQQTNTAQTQLQNSINEIDTLNKKYAVATSQAEKNKIRAEFNQADKNLTATQKFEEGTKFAGQGKYNEAVKLLNEALQINPNDAEIQKALAFAYYGRAYGFINSKNYTSAITDLNKAIEFKPNYDIYYSWRAEAYRLNKNYTRALEDINKAIGFAPTISMSSVSVAVRATIYADLKDYKRAFEDFDRAIRYSSAPVIREKRAKVYFDLKDYVHAIEDLTYLINDYPGASYYYLRARCYQALGETQKARADFEMAKKLGYQG